MNENQNCKSMASITDVARMVGLSRARFYQLMQQGIFPCPKKDETTKRPYFDHEQQQKCLLIRKTNCGENGKAILFYSKKLDQLPVPKLPSKRKRRADGNGEASKCAGDPVIDSLRAGLSQLGLAEVTTESVRRALRETHPDGWASKAEPELLMTVFRWLKRRDSHDNLP